MRIFISGSEYERDDARELARGFIEDGHEITYDWFSSTPPEMGGATFETYQALHAMGRLMGALHADVTIAFDSEDPAVGAIAGWNCAAPVGMHRHAIVIATSRPQITHLRNIHHVISPMAARAAVYIYGPSEQADGEV